MMMKKLAFKPSSLKANVENEPMRHKVRIVAFAVAMAVVASPFRYYFDSVVYRSGQMQMRALSNSQYATPRDREDDNPTQFVDFYDKDSLVFYGLRQDYEIWKDKPMKEIKQIAEDWKTTTYTRQRQATDENGIP